MHHAIWAHLGAMLGPKMGPFWGPKAPRLKDGKRRKKSEAEKTLKQKHIEKHKENQ